MFMLLSFIFLQSFFFLTVEHFLGGIFASFFFKLQSEFNRILCNVTISPFIKSAPLSAIKHHPIFFVMVKKTDSTLTQPITCGGRKALTAFRIAGQLVRIHCDKKIESNDDVPQRIRTHRTDS